MNMKLQRIKLVVFAFSLDSQVACKNLKFHVALNYKFEMAGLYRLPWFVWISRHKNLLS